MLIKGYGTIYSTMRGLMFGGDPPAPGVGESTAAQLQAYSANLPELLRITNAQIGPNELAQLQSQQATAPAYAALQNQLYAQYGPEMNRVGQEIARENALAQSATDAAVLQGSGRDAARAGMALDRETDPEYYKLRETMGSRLEDLMRPGLSGGETEAITRGLNQQNVGAGLLNTPSQTNVVSKAMTYGNAARDRLSQALGQATQALPTFRSGVDSFGRATGKLGTLANSGDAKFQGLQQQGAGQQAFGLSNNLLGETGQNQRAKMGIDAQRRDSLDRVGEVWGNVNGTISACCFIFLECHNGVLPWWVRKHRDMYYRTEPTIARGYVKMAKWLVPLMERSEFVKQMVNELMVKPMTNYGAYLEGVDSEGIVNKTTNNFWLKFWKFYGSF